MQILPIKYQVESFLYNKNNKHNHNQKNVTYPNQLAFGTLRVDKRTPRFSDFNEQKKRVPTELKKLYSTLENKLSVTPIESMQKAYANLNMAKTIKDIQRLFPEEELFLYLTPLKDAISKVGIIGIYKNLEDKYRNGILKNKEEFTVYLVKKLFAEAKTTYKEINDDLDNDLVPEIKDTFQRKYGNNEYIKTDVLQALEIYPPDLYFRNSLKFTQEGYSDAFGLTISRSLMERLNKMTEEEKFAEINTRAEGLEAWWNSMSYEEKLELVAGVDSQDEVYKNYRKYANENRRNNRKYLNSLPEFAKLEPDKKVKTRIKLSDKDVFILWMQKNLSKYRDSLSEVEKSVVAIKQSKQQAKRWKEMTPEQKTECINRMRTDKEPIQYAMYDAWNHSPILIMALSEFLREKHAERPADMVYGTNEYNDFQSKIMTEFWEKNSTLADGYSTQIKYSHTKIEDAIRNGTFEELKKQIEKERDARKKIFAEAIAENAKPVKTEENQKSEKNNTVPEIKHGEYVKDFLIEYKRRFNFLPSSYVREMGEIIANSLPKNIIEEYTMVLIKKQELSQETTEKINAEISKSNNPRVARLQRAIEVAIAKELVYRGEKPELFEMNADNLIPILEKKLKQTGLPKQLRIDAAQIEKMFNYYKKDMDEEELDYIINNYFSANRISGATPEEEIVLKNYINTYGRVAAILFPSGFSGFSNAERTALNNKFLSLMPQEVKDATNPLIKNADDVSNDYQIAQVRGQIAKRFDFIPKDALDTYTRFVAATIRTFNESKDAEPEEKEKFSLENIQKMLCRQHLDENGEISALRMPKYAIVNKESRLKLLAAEQAIANELFRVINVNAEVYNMELEDLAVTIEMLKDIIKKSKKLVPNFKKEGVQFPNKEGSILVAKIEPSPDNINRNYLDIMNEIYNKFGTIINEDDTINEEELLYILNPDEEKEALDDYILERIKKYTVLDKDHAQNNN